MEANPWFPHDASQIDQLLRRPAVGYQPTRPISLRQGYARVANFQRSYTPEYGKCQHSNDSAGPAPKNGGFNTQTGYPFALDHASGNVPAAGLPFPRNRLL